MLASLKTETAGPKVSEVSLTLPALLMAYASVLEKAGHEPVFHVRHRPDRDKPPADRLSAFVWWLGYPLRLFREWWWGFTIGPIVKLFVETHINAKITEIGRFLRGRRLQVAAEDNEDTRALDDLLRLVSYAESMVTGWSRFFSALRFLPGLIMVASWSVAALSYRDLTTALIMAFTALVPLLMLIIYPILVRFGFRWKRAIFTAWPLDPRSAVDSCTRKEAGRSSVYELENRVYHDLGLKKHSELPLDVILHPAPYWLLTVLFLIVMPLISAQIRGDMAPARLVVVTAFEAGLIFVFVVPIWSAVSKYRKRKAAGLS